MGCKDYPEGTWLSEKIEMFVRSEPKKPSKMQLGLGFDLRFLGPRGPFR